MLRDDLRRRNGAAQPVDMDTVLGKAVSVLYAFAADDHELGFAELGRRTGLPKGTLHRVLGDLVAVRLLDRTKSSYRLSGRMFELGMRASVERRLLEVAVPFLEDLYERIHETVHLGVPEGDEVVYLAKIGGHRQTLAPSRIGGRMPVHCTALGKVLLAHSDPGFALRILRGQLTPRTPRTVTQSGRLDRQLGTVRETGVAYEYEESALGIACVAAPVLDADGHPVAAISVTGQVPGFQPDKHAIPVRAAASGIAAVLARRVASCSGF